MKVKKLKRKFSASELRPQRLTVKGEMITGEFSEELLPSGEYLSRDIMKTAPNNITTNDKSVLNNRKG
ncbi:hypothetical protein [Desulfolucanica intricata]|uniref:hypothetical protein n=1 Tax=Desulfolucanica intricata TaxID=1285191 RepID=UPI00083577A1|nr:hypothetical protein [Desulfolucanica intricata]